MRNQRRYGPYHPSRLIQEAKKEWITQNIGWREFWTVIAFSFVVATLILWGM